MTYRWRANKPTLHKFVEITNRSAAPVRLMDIGLGRYATKARVTEGEQGFPVYAAGSFFFTVAHPSGWAMGQRGAVTLRQHPGQMLAPGETFRAMEVVLGVAEPQQARAQFVAHVRRRTRRVQRGHDKPYAICEPFGGWRIPKGKSLGETESEKILCDHIRQLTTARRRAGLRFDMFSIDFWVDNDGDMQRPDPKYFPRGFAPVLRALQRLGTAPGLWIDSSMSVWTIGQNPAVASCHTHEPAYLPNTISAAGFLCRATEPVRAIYQTAFTHHLRDNGVRLAKFDNLHAICYHRGHDHLPGLYSTEAIHNSVIEFLHALDRANRDVFLMLYWGYRSPWWLLHADTLFEPGLCIEAASPAPQPTLYARDGVTQGLDMAQWYCDDLPALGKDSLGVWLSDWPWNSQVGKERWPEGFVMDLCRGSLLAQPWNGERPLTVAEQKQMAEFIALLKGQPKCFANSRFILGNPWKNEPYGYSCSDGQRTFLALNNCTWRDQLLPIEAHGRDVYRWYPRPARLTGDTTQIALRPFEVVLLELVPADQPPTLGKKFRRNPMPVGFREPSQTLPFTSRTLRVPASARSGTLVITAERIKDGVAFQTQNPGTDLTITAKLAGRLIKGQPVLGTFTYPSAWQAWRFRLPASPRASAVQVQLQAKTPKGVRVCCRGHFIPR